MTQTRDEREVKSENERKIEENKGEIKPLKKCEQ